MLCKSVWQSIGVAIGQKTGGTAVKCIFVGNPANDKLNGNPKDADNSLTGAVLAMSRGDGLYQG